MKQKTINFIKNWYKFIILYSIFLFICFYSFDYEITCPGGVNALEDYITVEGYDTTENFNTTYVSARRGTILNILLSYIIPNWDLESLDSTRVSNETYDELTWRGILTFNNSNELSKQIVFENAGIEYEKVIEGLYVYYTTDVVSDTLRTGDKLLQINDTTINSLEDFSTLSFEVGEIINITLSRNNKEMEVSVTITESNGVALIGIGLIEQFEIISEIDVTYDYGSNSQGASGGLMTTLQLYSYFTEEDIAGDLTVAGTGAIAIDGTVEEIDGIKYKIIGANNNDVDIFIAPTDNYEEALKYIEEFGYDMILIEAKTFEQVLAELKKYN